MRTKGKEVRRLAGLLVVLSLGCASRDSAHATRPTNTTAPQSSTSEPVPSEPLELVFDKATGSQAHFTPPAQPGERFAVEFDASRDQYPNVVLPLAGAPRDLSDWPAIAFDVTNSGAGEIMVIGTAGTTQKTSGCVYVQPGATETLWIFLRKPGGGDPAYEAKYPAMYGKPGDHMFAWYPSDPKAINYITLWSAEPDCPGKITVSRVRLSYYHPRPQPDPLSDAFFPIVDEFGQYSHCDWPGKTHTAKDLTEALAAEDRDLAAHPGPAEWDQYGGWAKGPQLQATGHFRTEKVDGRWWLVDPEGHLFWSVGSNDFQIEGSTRITGRDKMFAWIPAQDDPQFGRFLTGKDRVGFDFYKANLLRKFGADWEATALARTQQRMRSWGLNTIGNWSDARLQRQRRAPYTYNVQYRFPALNNQKCPDAANPQFRANLRAALEKAAPSTVNDPWCIGYFIDNEVAWPKTDGGPNAEQYFQICREEVKRVAPDMLYLGSRLADHLWPEFDQSGEPVIVAAAHWCDVVSFNRYRFNPGRLRLPAGFDKPIIIGEFHIGAPDRGPLHHGVYGVGSQSQRAEAYKHYLHECLDNPAIVGAHWYRYVDQCVTGRSDGENYQIGLVDICDTPYPETIAAVREVGYHLYQYRTTPRTAAK